MFLIRALLRRSACDGLALGILRHIKAYDSVDYALHWSEHFVRILTEYKLHAQCIGDRGPVRRLQGVDGVDDSRADDKRSFHC